MQTENPVTIVYAWQDAANQQDAARMIEVSDPNIEIVGPRGSAVGYQILRDWLGRAGLTLTTLRTFAREDRVVLAQHGVWQSLETGAPAGEASLASSFQVAAMMSFCCAIRSSRPVFSIPDMPPALLSDAKNSSSYGFTSRKKMSLRDSVERRPRPTSVARA